MSHHHQQQELQGSKQRGASKADKTKKTSLADDSDEEDNRITLVSVLRCVGDILLDSSCYGLDITDCARLAVVSRDVKAEVAANRVWQKALSTLESDFPLVPQPLGPQGPPTQVQTVDWGLITRPADPPKVWRHTLGEPRYEKAIWEEASTMRRFGLLLSFAQDCVKTLRQISLKADKRWFKYIFDYDELDDPIKLHLIHIQYNYAERYELAVKLAVANIAEQGFHESDEDDPEQGPYYVVDDALEAWLSMHIAPHSSLNNSSQCLLVHQQ